MHTMRVRKCIYAAVGMEAAGRPSHYRNVLTPPSSVSDSNPVSTVWRSASPTSPFRLLIRKIQVAACISLKPQAGRNTLLLHTATNVPADFNYSRPISQVKR